MHKQNVGLAVAMSESGILGIRHDTGKTSIPWRVNDGLTWFRALCVNKTVVLGRSTFEECKGFLKFWNVQQVNVLTSNPGSVDESLGNGIGAVGIDDGFDFDEPDTHFLVAGGLSTYETFLYSCGYVSLTIVPDSAVTALGEGDSYIQNPHLLKEIKAVFNLKRTAKWAAGCEIYVGPVSSTDPVRAPAEIGS